jgi:hypothetical protein
LYGLCIEISYYIKKLILPDNRMRDDHYRFKSAK